MCYQIIFSKYLKINFKLHLNHDGPPQQVTVREFFFGETNPEYPF